MGGVCTSSSSKQYEQLRPDDPAPAAAAAATPSLERVFSREALPVENPTTNIDHPAAQPHSLERLFSREAIREESPKFAPSPSHASRVPELDLSAPTLSRLFSRTAQREATASTAAAAAGRITTVSENEPLVPPRDSPSGLLRELGAVKEGHTQVFSRVAPHKQTESQPVPGELTRLFSRSAHLEQQQPAAKKRTTLTTPTAAESATDDSGSMRLRGSTVDSEDVRVYRVGSSLSISQFEIGEYSNSPVAARKTSVANRFSASNSPTKKLSSSSDVTTPAQINADFANLFAGVATSAVAQGLIDDDDDDDDEQRIVEDGSSMKDEEEEQQPNTEELLEPVAQPSLVHQSSSRSESSAAAARSRQTRSEHFQQLFKNLPTVADKMVEGNVQVDTPDHEDHTFSGIMFDVVSRRKLPVEFVEIQSFSVRGELGGITIWTCPVTYSGKRDRPDKWTKVYDRHHSPSPTELCTLELETPIRLAPGMSMGVYIHSNQHGDRALVYDNYRSRTTHKDDLLRITSGEAHISHVPFSNQGFWGHGAWRPGREFVGRVRYGAKHLLYNPNVHFKFNASYRNAVVAFVSCTMRRESSVHRLPLDVVFRVLNSCGHDWFDSSKSRRSRGGGDDDDDDNEDNRSRKRRRKRDLQHLQRRAYSLFSMRSSERPGSESDDSSESDDMDFASSDEDGADGQDSFFRSLRPGGAFASDIAQMRPGEVSYARWGDRVFVLRRGPPGEDGRPTVVVVGEAVPDDDDDEDYIPSDEDDDE